MKLDFNTIQNHLLVKFKSESELVKTIEQLSLNFTKNRESLNDYLSDKKMVAAYACFYMLTNIPKLEASFDKMNLNLDDYLDYEFFDIGSGPATFSLSLLALNDQVKISLIEKSEVMQEQGEKLLKAFFPDSNVSYIKDIPAKTKKRFGIFGHSANEMGKDIVKKFIEDLELDYILFIEPGTKQSFSILKDLRATLLEKYKIHYPCMGQANCPMTQDDWCHQYLSITHDPSTERLTQLAKKDRRNLPITLHFYGKKDQASESSSLARIIRAHPPTKFSLEWEVCYFDGEIFQIESLQVLVRGMSKKEVKYYQSFSAGDKISFQVVKRLGDKKLRGTICHFQD